MTAQVLPLVGKLLSPKAVAERLGVNVHRIYRWAESGKLRTFRPDARGVIGITEADLAAFIAVNMTAPAPVARPANGPRPHGDVSDLMPASGRRY